MIIRFLTQDDIISHDKVSSQAFCSSCNVGDPESVLPGEKVLGAFDDDNRTLFADFEINERKCYYDGEILTCAAIGGVAAKPEHRGKGAVTALFEYLFNKTCYDISILYPFSEEYYRRLGYERAGFCVNAEVPFAELSKIKRNQDAVIYEGENPERLLEIYNKCARRYRLCFVRDNTVAFSDKPYYSQKYTYIWKNSAYAIVRVDRDRSTVFVSEIYFDSLESMLGILGFLRNFESNQTKVCFQKLPENTPLFHVIRDIKKCDIRMYDTGAVRILNVEKVLKAHRYPASDSAFTMRIGDDLFCVAVKGGKADVKKDPSAVPDVTMDISTASGVLLSGADGAAYRPGLVIHNQQSDFFKLFPPKVPFFTDEF
ncbi:MAG: GNAT family N-acetyltransferase [Clostridiales bacterium]|nr:GNAT family N-acetyltransferase [Clostridiales bacterium]